MKKFFYLFVFFLTGLFTFFSCNRQKEDLQLSVNAWENVDFDSEGLYLQTGLEWCNITVTGYLDDYMFSVESSESWCNVSITGAMFSIRVDKNTSTNPRTCNIYVKGKNSQVVLKIWQAGGSGNSNGGGGDDNGGGNETTLSAPTNVKAVQSGTNMVVSWNSVSGATSYIVSYSNTSSSPTYSFNPITSTSLTVDAEGAAEGNYYFWVKACNSSSESNYSSYAYCNYSSGGGGGGGTGTAPNPPTGVSATQSGNNIIVSWYSVSGATSYEVYYSQSAYGTYSKSSKEPTSTNWTDIEPYTGANYYKVKAKNLSGTSDFSNYVYCNFTTGGGGGGGDANYAPCPVGSPTATGTSSITVSWSAPSTATGCGKATNYDIYKHNPTTGSFELKANRTSTSWSDSDPHPGINRYAIKAKNSYGESSANYAHSSSRTLATPPSSAMNTISWGSGSQNLNILINPQKGATSYYIYYSQTASGTYSLLGSVDDSERLGGYVNFNRSFPVQRGTTWYFKIATVWSTPYGSPSQVISSQSSYKSYTLP